MYGLVKKCTLKREDADFRPVLQRLVEDLCAVLNSAQWPAAELLLRSLTLVLRHEVTKANAQLSQGDKAAKAKQGADNNFRAFLADVLGTIITTIQAHKRAAAQAQPSAAAAAAAAAGDGDGDGDGDDVGPS